MGGKNRLGPPLGLVHPLGNPESAYSLLNLTVLQGESRGGGDREEGEGTRG